MKCRRPTGAEPQSVTSNLLKEFCGSKILMIKMFNMRMICLFVIVQVVTLMSSCKSSPSIGGKWLVKEADGGIFPGYFNRLKRSGTIFFGTDSAAISSGIFHYIDNPNADDNARGRFPFVF